MTDALDQVGTVNTGGRTATNLRFAEYIDGLPGDEQEPVNLVSRLDKTSASYGMEITAEKTKPMTNNINGVNKKINVRGQRLETVSTFDYLGSDFTDGGFKPEIISKIAQTTTTLTIQKTIWKDKNITLRSKIRLILSHVMSIFIYACNTLTLITELQRRVQAMEIRCYRKILFFSHNDHVINEEVHNIIQQAMLDVDYITPNNWSS